MHVDDSPSARAGLCAKLDPWQKRTGGERAKSGKELTARRAATGCVLVSVLRVTHAPVSLSV
jgi:hypothetical protein